MTLIAEGAGVAPLALLNPRGPGDVRRLLQDQKTLEERKQETGRT